MNIELPTRKEGALTGMPVNQPRMNTDRVELAGEKAGRWEDEKRCAGGTRSPDRHGLGNHQIRGADTKDTKSDGDSHLSPALCPHRMAEREENQERRGWGQASPFPPSDGGKDAVLTPADANPDAGGTRPYLGGEAEFLRLLFEFTHSVQLNPDRTVALAAKRWERSLRFKLAVARQRRRDAGCRRQETGSSRGES